MWQWCWRIKSIVFDRVGLSIVGRIFRPLGSAVGWFFEEVRRRYFQLDILHSGKDIVSQSIVG